MAVRDYVVQTKPCHEAIARANLAALGFEAYVPTVREEIRTRDSRTTVLAPMFHCYIFVRLDLADPRWREARHAKGVVALLPHSDTPVAVPECAMAWVRESEAAENAKKVRGVRPEVDVGDQVKFADGSWMGKFGLIQGINSRGDRLRVLLTIMGAAREVQVDVHRVMRRTA